MSQIALRVAVLTLVLSVAGCAAPSLRSEPTAPTAGWDNSVSRTTEEPEAEDQVELCVESKSLIRAEYQPCDDREPGYARYFVPITVKVPTIGKKVTKGSFQEPAQQPYRAPAKAAKGRSAMFLDRADHFRLCVNVQTRTRVANDGCEDDGNDWYFIPLTRVAPAVGRKAEGGSFYISAYAHTFKVQKSGGKGRRVTLDDTPRYTQDDTTDDDCTETVNGRCTVREGCQETFNDVCTDDGAENPRDSDTRTTRPCTTTRLNERRLSHCY